MLEDAPTNIPPGDSWHSEWQRWFKRVCLRLAGWNQTKTATLTHDFGAIGAGGLLATTLTVMGVRQGDGVLVTPYSGLTGIIYYGEITANDTVRVCAQNVTSGSLNPISTTFRIIVFMQ